MSTVDGLRDVRSREPQSTHDHASTGNIGSQADTILIEIVNPDKYPKIMMPWRRWRCCSSQKNNLEASYWL